MYNQRYVIEMQANGKGTIKFEEFNPQHFSTTEGMIGDWRLTMSMELRSSELARVVEVVNSIQQARFQDMADKPEPVATADQIASVIRGLHDHKVTEQEITAMKERGYSILGYLGGYKVLYPDDHRLRPEIAPLYKTQDAAWSEAYIDYYLGYLLTDIVNKALTAKDGDVSDE